MSVKTRAVSLRAFMAIDLDEAERLTVRPPVIPHITRDAAAGWRGNPRWLGNIARGAGVVAADRP